VKYLRPHLERVGVECADNEFLCKIIIAQRERVKTLKEMAANSRYFFGETVMLDEKAAVKHLTEEAKLLLSALKARLVALSEWTAAAVHAALEQLAAEQGVGLGKIAQPLRVAVTGGTISPPIDFTLELLGRERTLARLSAVGVSSP
jgi:glutamyl-tRNA synthetase